MPDPMKVLNLTNRRNNKRISISAKRKLSRAVKKNKGRKMNKRAQKSLQKRAEKEVNSTININNTYASVNSLVADFDKKVSISSKKSIPNPINSLQTKQRSRVISFLKISRTTLISKLQL